MPQQWWFVLREKTHGQGGFSPNACNGLINEFWPQPDDRAHAQAKSFVLHGFPQPVGSGHLWSVTWLSDREEPPRDLRDQSGLRWELGRRSFDVESVIAGPRRSWAYLLETPPTPRILIQTVTPVLNARSFDKQRVWTPYPTLPALLGAAPTAGQKSENHRQNGIRGVVGSYADPHIAMLVSEQIERAVPTLTVIPAHEGHVVKLVPSPKGQAWGWTGKCTLSAKGPAGHQGLALIGAIMRTTGIGRSTAYGYGCVSVEQVGKAAAPESVSHEQATVTMSDDGTEEIHGSDCPDLLFEEIE